MKHLSILALALLCALSSYAQEAGKIIGIVKETNDEPVAFANVLLNSTADSSMVKAEFTTDEGRFEFVGVSAGSYYIEISYVGLPTYYSPAFDYDGSSEKLLAPISMSADGTELATVTVTAQRKLIEVKPDKIVFNVEGSINATGNNGLELLRKAPGVMIDQNNNIILTGKSGVQVYIDGRPSQLSGDDLVNFLQSLNSSQIDNIEIITQPGAKYEAEGNAGIINIKLKKDKRFGSNGSISADFNQGEEARYNGTATGNFRNSKINLFGNASYNGGAWWNEFNMRREQFGQYFDMRTISVNPYDGYNFKAGMDYFVGKQHTVGILINGNGRAGTGDEQGITEIGTLGAPVDSILSSGSFRDYNNQNYNFNLNYVYDNSKGRTLNVDADYGFFRNRGEVFQPNAYMDPEMEFVLSENNLGNETATDIDIATLNIAYEQPLGKGKLEAGGRFSYVSTFNVFDFFDYDGTTPIFDPLRSNDFEYTENVNALYAAYQQQFGKLGVQAGLRVEQTNMEGVLTAVVPTEEDNVKRSFTDLFPSAGLSYQLNQKNLLSFSYSRRIDRPSYSNLNPFLEVVNELAFEKGNPFLRPQYSHNVQLTHTWNYMINTSLGYTRTNDLITRINDVQGEDAAFITYDNVAEQDNISLSISAPVYLKKWWNMYTNVSAFYLDNQSDFGNGRVVDVQVTSGNLYMQHTFTLPWELSLELSGWYNTPSVWGGTFETDHMGAANIGLQKKILDGAGNIRVGYDDFLHTAGWRAVSVFGPLTARGSGRWDSRVLKFNFSYSFGNRNVKSRRRKAGNSDEQGRAGDGGGGIGG